MATNPYSTQSISGFNASAPADDGSQVEANKTKWADQVIAKVGTPLKDLAEDIDSAMVTAGTKLINIDANENNAMAGSLAYTESTLTISSDAVAATRSAHVLAAETSTTDDLKNITTGSVSDGCILHIRADTGDTITVKDAATGAGEIHLDNNADYAMSGDNGLILQRRGADWYEIARSGVPGATQAEMEAASITDLAVTPGRQHNHPSAAKAWCSVNRGGGTPSLDSPSYNITSVADDGAGNTAITIATDFSSGAFAALATPSAAVGDFCNCHSRANSLYDVHVYDDTAGDADTTSFTTVAFGDQ